MGLFDLFGSAEPTNDTIVRFQKEMAKDAERRAEDLKLRRQGAYDQINAIFDGGVYDPTQYAAYDWDAIDKNAELYKLAGRDFKRDYILRNMFFAGMPGVPQLTQEDRQRYLDAQNAVDPDEYRPRVEVDDRPRVEVDGEAQTYTGIGDDFYNSYRQSILDYYRPQLDRNYQDASGATMLNYARSGTRKSSAAGEAQGDLRRDYDLQAANLYQSADTQTSGLRDRVEAERNALLDLAASAEDPTIAANRALTEVNAIQPAPQLSPLGDLFQAAAIGYGGYQNARNRQAFNQGYYGNTGGGFSGSGRTYG